MFLHVRELLPKELAAELVAALADAPFTDGRATALGPTRDVKKNLQLDPSHPTAKALHARVAGALARSDAFKSAALPHTILPMIFARYDEGMAYGEHLDVPIMASAKGPLRVDLAMTVWLSPRESYDGGELRVRAGATDPSVVTFKGEAGDAVVYAASQLHEVTPVTRGARLVAVTWMQSLVRDAGEREILFSLVDVIGRLSARAGNEAEIARLRHLHHALVRRWSDA